MSGSRIIAHLLNISPAVTAVVPVQKQFLDDVAQGVEPPYILITDAGGGDGVHLSGQDRYPRERVQIDCVAKGAFEVRDLCRMVNESLIDTIKRTIITPGTTGLRVKDVDIIEANTPIGQYADNREFRILSQDYYVRWRRL